MKFANLTANPSLCKTKSTGAKSIELPIEKHANSRGVHIWISHFTHWIIRSLSTVMVVLKFLARRFRPTTPSPTIWVDLNEIKSFLYCFRSSKRLSFRQLSDSKHIIELIYDENSALIDCEFGHQKDRVKTFLRSFRDDLKGLVNSANISLQPLDDRRLPPEYGWLNYTELRKECHQTHLMTKKEMDQLQDSRRSDLFERSVEW